MSNSHEWQFDNAWQEMLNHATIKVMEAETQKTDSGQEHQRRALIFNTAEQKVQQLEEKLRRHILKSRPYFEENQICQDQLKTQKARIAELQGHIQVAKKKYSTALRSLENISEDIHRQRGDLMPVPQGPREPGVGAELSSPMTEEAVGGRSFVDTPDGGDDELEVAKREKHQLHFSNDLSPVEGSNTTNTISAAISDTETPSGCVSESDDDDEEDDGEEEDNERAKVVTTLGEDEDSLESLRQKVKVLAIRPVEGGEGKPQEQSNWEYELTETINKLDHLMMIRELKSATKNTTTSSSSAPVTPLHKPKEAMAVPKSSGSPLPPIKMLKGGGQLPAYNSSLNELSVTQLMPFVLPFPLSSCDSSSSASDVVAFGLPGSSAVAAVAAAASGNAGSMMGSVVGGGGVGGTASTRDQKRKLSI